MCSSDLNFGAIGGVRSMAIGVVVECDTDDGFCFRKQGSHILSARCIHPIHVRLIAIFQPSLEFFWCFVIPIGQTSEPDFMEIEIEKFLLNLRSVGAVQGEYGKLR